MMHKRAGHDDDGLQTPECRRGSTIKKAIEQPSRAITRPAPPLAPANSIMAVSSTSLAVPASHKVGSTQCKACAACWVVDPHKSLWLSYWDLMTFLALFYTAIVTPVEVSFLTSPKAEDRLSNGLFLANRAVDLIFILGRRLDHLDLSLLWPPHANHVLPLPEALRNV